MNPYLRAAKTPAGKARMKAQAAAAQQKRKPTKPPAKPAK